jgi:hypothetical protein
MAILALVGKDEALPAPPYPKNTRAKGWRFELDYERLEGSDTWAICPPEIRPWLLMMWLRAWQSFPCGTFTNDDLVIAGRIGMPINLFRAHKEVLQRGWRLHSDGRLYHEAITERVLCLLLHRTKEAEWKAGRRASLKSDSLQNHGVTENVQPDSARSPSVVVAPVPVPVVKPKTLVRKADGLPAGFLEFWQAYPHVLGRSSRAVALKRWQTAGLESSSAQVIACVQACKRSPDWTRESGAFVPGAQVWLNRKLWLQDLAGSRLEDETSRMLRTAI